MEKLSWYKRNKIKQQKIYQGLTDEIITLVKGTDTLKIMEIKFKWASKLESGEFLLYGEKPRAFGKGLLEFLDEI